MQTTMHQPFITAETVAGLIGLPDPASFLRQRQRLEDEAGFPLPMPTSQRPLRWRRAQVEAWVQSQGRPRAQVPAELPPNVFRLLRQARAS